MFLCRITTAAAACGCLVPPDRIGHDEKAVGWPHTLVARIAEQWAISRAPVRSHDAIHIASAQQLQAALDALVTYDESMLTAARALGLPVSRPT